MSVKRFFAETARDALRQVKEQLGPDAIVVSNRAVNGGIEITAMSAESLDALSHQATADAVAVARPARAVANGAPLATPAAPSMAAPAFVPVDEDYTVSLSSQARKQPAFRPWQPGQQAAAPMPASAPAAQAAPRPAPSAGAVPNSASRLRPLPSRAPAGAGVPSREQVAATLRDALTDTGDDGLGSRAPAGEVESLLQEMRAIKGMLSQQLAGFAWGDLSRNSPTRALLLSEMLDAGFSGQMARRLTTDMPGDIGLDEGRKWLMAGLNRRLRTLGNEGDLIERGGVYALVGPTGVGKTTTTAKLAARCVVRYGADKVALLTTDGYRIGAHEQLRIYGRILGIPVHIVRDGDDLRHTLSDLRDKHMVLIDTVGMSQRDRMVAEQAAMLMRAGEVNRLLLLNSTSRGDTLDDVIRSYAGEDVAGCIITKTDETASLAPVIDAVVRHGLLLTYVANGQRVPEDMHLPNRTYLLHRAFKLPASDSAHRLRDREVGMVLNRDAQTSKMTQENSLG